jgi:hypothetical protein
MAIITTGQFTITDNNDAKAVNAVISSSKALVQSYNADNAGSAKYTPDYTQSPYQVLTAKVTTSGVGSESDITTVCTNGTWYRSDAPSTPLANGVDYAISGSNNSVITLKTNLTSVANESYSYQYSANYTDPTTGLVTTATDTIINMMVTKGSNAVHAKIEGQTAFKKSMAVGTKNTVTLTGVLVRGSSIDDDNLKYKWFKAPYGATDQLDYNHPDVVAGRVGFLDKAAINAGVQGATGTFKTTASGTPNTITSTNFPDGAVSDAKALVINEDCVNGVGTFMVQITDTVQADGPYSGYITITDQSDPVQAVIRSTAGDKLQNGQGQTILSADVYYGATKVADLTGYTYLWSFFDQSGTPTALVDSAKLSGGTTISSNTNTNSFTLSGTPSPLLAAGDVIKVINSTNTATSVKYYEVSANTGAAVTIKTSGWTCAWVQSQNVAPATNEFQNGKMFFCGNGASAGTKTTATITVTGNDIDVKGTITCQVTKP